MDAPKCRLCEKRHYGLCAEAVVPSEPRVRKPGKSVGPKKKSKARGGEDSGLASRSTDGIEELLARVESLESRLDAMDKRRVYQRDLMRVRRAKEKKNEE